MEKSFEKIRDELLNDWLERGLIGMCCVEAGRSKDEHEFTKWVLSVLKDVLTEKDECNASGNIALVNCIINLIQLKQGVFA